MTSGQSSGEDGDAFPHLSDLSAKALSRVDPHAPITRLLRVADEASRQADILLEYRRPHLAYIEYLTAFEIIAIVVPRSKEAPLLRTDSDRLARMNRELMKRLNQQHDRFLSVKNIIIYDNKRSKVQPTLSSGYNFAATRNQLASSTPVMDNNATNSARLPAQFERPTSSQGADGFNYGNHSIDSLQNSSPTARHQVVIVEAKDSQRQTSRLNQDSGRLIGDTSARLPGGRPDIRHSDPLSERFARLRMNGSAYGSVGNEAPIHPQAHGYLSASGKLRMPSPTGHSINSQPKPLAANGYVHHSHSEDKYGRPSTAGKPYPTNGSVMAPTSLQAIDLLPKAPSPTYKPARNNEVRTLNHPSDTSPEKYSKAMRGNPPTRPNMDHHLDIYSDGGGGSVLNSSYTTHSERPKSAHLPKEERISAEKLYDYLRLYHVLLIDVRRREDYDQGHIYTQSIICIEPAALRDNMSAEELQDSLVLSPEGEQALFYRRDEFDLLVYYDQCAWSTSFLTNERRTESELALKRLHDALYEFNHEKPLQRPPILLSGGLDAWGELVGQSALMMSDTLAAVSIKRSVKVNRQQLDSSFNGRLQAQVSQRRRLQDYNPLNPEEEQSWLQRAREEGAAVDERSSFEHTDDHPSTKVTPQIYRNYDEFLRRVPDAPAPGQQSMVTIPPLNGQFSVERAKPVPSVPSRPPPTLPRVSYSGVNDRVTAPVTVQSRATPLPSYIPPSQLPQNLRLPKTGLINFGVTCYMNATIQCLSATLILTTFFRGDQFRAHVQKDNWKGSRGVMPELYANLIRSLWKGDVSYIRPLSFRNFCARLNRDWGLDQQQDAKEFLEFLLDCLHEDLNVMWSRSPLQALTAKEEAVRESMPMTIVARKEWERYQHRDKSFISNLFAGQHASRLRCTTCRHTSTTYEAFYSISVEIPRSGRGHIYDCLRSYCSEEKLSGDEVWKCPRCQVEREATKQILCTRAPEFLVIHFKRFSASRGETARKVRTPIEFPLHCLDLQPFMLASPSDEEADHISQIYGAEALRPQPSMTSPYIYEAYAVMRHLGNTLTSGHYTALVKDNARGCWKQFNDHRVDDFDPESLPENNRLQNEQAYIVFYQRVSAPA